MRRSWAVPRDRQFEGHERAHELASVLAQTCSPEVLEHLVQAMQFLNGLGGQVFIAADRPKFDPETGKVCEDQRDPDGIFATTGYIFIYEHIATALRSADREPEPDAKRPIAVAPMVAASTEDGDGGDANS